MNTHLDSFETELLAELRGVVAERAPRPARSRLRPRYAVAAAGAAAVAAAVALPGLLGSPAYAVSDGPHGTITVQVNRLEDAPGLQRALEERGVRADVQYLGTDLQCSPRRFRKQLVGAADSATVFAIASDGIELVLDRRDVAHGETVVIAASRIKNGISADVGIAAGPVAPCRPVPRPPDPG